MVRIALLEDHLMFRQMLRDQLHNRKDYKVVLDVETCDEFRKKYDPDSVDLILMDIRLKEESGLSLCLEMFYKYPGAKIIILSAYLENFIILQAIKHGASGFVNKTDCSSVLEKTIREVLLNGYYYNTDIGALIRDEMERTKVRRSYKDIFRIEFSDREIDIVVNHSNQMSNDEIGKKLKISKRTVENIKTEMCSKINCRNFVGVMLYFFKYYIIFPQDFDCENTNIN